ncbi:MULTISPECIES: phosphonate ABC transporter ATP-binding protein [Oceanobacillus]|uniref:Phosphonates import ATP-binding protein PhnC n=1 Tax=Oceanobacillus kimchii TaxID=746691 RepID=A0ABQ5TPF8_9BACI|nr:MULTISPECIES: phosphonate ABC transporter ATP-binding protein [Oceanobacillus]MBT2600447.1 phosphonate ABC transporter ATP-binding protein [Oceanobacillus sp. ISL-74]MBT2650605.1 phosphonate ABC transporter ATP-binding protein [Oceanobacillus sp. ISL-73]GLO67498.1 phosphonates import ATP-binding protein PhnC [Oceanobacillus kimchii]
MNSLLSIKNLVKVYGKDTRALNGISLDFYPGEFIVIIGPSGAGKSTLIRNINRLVDPTKGEVIFDGQHLEKLSGRKLRKERSKIGMIFQHYNLVGRTNVIKNVLHGQLSNVPLYKSLFGLYRHEDKQEAITLLKKVGLEDQIYKRADTLSGGQMQRVGICRAILQRPQLLLADEPIASLDPLSANIVMQQLHTISQEKKLTCIVNLHQVDYAKKYATRIIGIKKGTVVFDGSPSQLTDEITQDIYEGKESQLTLKGEGEVVEKELDMGGEQSKRLAVGQNNE